MKVTLIAWTKELIPNVGIIDLNTCIYLSPAISGHAAAFENIIFFAEKEETTLLSRQISNRKPISYFQELSTQRTEQPSEL